MVKHSKEENKKLCERFPFLIPRNLRDEVATDYDYDSTVLDWMDDGWRAAFGEQMMQEIMDAIGGDKDVLDEFRILEIKEKFGQLRMYCYGATKEIFDIISKYEEISERTCIKCGKPATKISLGWISPYCEDCGHGNLKGYVPVEEWFKGPTDD